MTEPDWIVTAKYDPKLHILLDHRAYDAMQNDLRLLDALHKAGVDNWENYGDACLAAMKEKG